MSCCVEIDNEYYEELMDYLLETNVDLNTLNIDDLVAEEHELYILKETEDGCWCI